MSNNWTEISINLPSVIILNKTFSKNFLNLSGFDQALIFRLAAEIQESTNRNNVPEVVGMLGRKQSHDLENKDAINSFSNSLQQLPSL